jgi:hypothetical protein
MLHLDSDHMINSVDEGIIQLNNNCLVSWGQGRLKLLKCLKIRY